MKIHIRLLPVLAIFLLLSGCKDDENYEAPKVTIDGITSVAPIPVGKEVSVAFKVFAPASIKTVTYSIINMAGNYEIVPVPSNGATELSVPITFTAEMGMLNVVLKVVDKKGKSDEATIPIERVLDKPGFFFTDNVTSIDLVIIGKSFDIDGIVVADVDLKDVYYTPFVNGIPQSREAIPIGDNKQELTFQVSPNTVAGLQKLEFTAIDELDRTVNSTFTIKKIQNIGLVIDQTSSRVLIHGETNHIRGQIFTGRPITEAKYYILKNGEEDQGHDITLDADNKFDFSLNVERGITSIRIACANEEDTDEDTWKVIPTGKLKYLEDKTLTMERYLNGDYSFFCCWKEPHLFHGSEMCNNPDEYVDWWDFSVYQRVGTAPIAIASPAAWGRGVQNANRVVHQVVPNAKGLDEQACRGPAEGTRPDGVENPEWNGSAANIKIPKMNYMMISSVRPELEAVFDRVSTEQDLWDLLDVVVDGKTIREIYDPVTNSTTQTNAIADGVYWIAWGPFNGSGKGGEKGDLAQNAGLGLLRVKWESGVTPAAKQVTFDIKFPEWPNYREVFKDSWIDIRHADRASGARAVFPVEFTFPGWPELL